MPTPPDNLFHNYRHDVAFPYISNSSVVSEDASFVDGSNVQSTIKGTLERRPGFPTYTADNFGANNTPLRYFSWQRWDGAYIVMVNVTDSGANISKVYKLQVGTDTTFQLIFTSAANTNPMFFVVAHNFVFFGNSIDMKKYDGTTVTTWGTATPASAPTIVNAGAGNVPGTIGHTWAYAYENSTSTLLSDLSTASAASSAANRTWTISGARSTDTQVDKVHVYRTEDGGSIWKEVSNSPIANPGSGTWSFTDNDLDISLKSTQSPLIGINAPPIAAYPCEQLYASRIFTWKNDTLYWSSLEEANNQGMFEEGFPVNNKRRFGRQITRVVVVGGVLLIYTVSGIFTLIGSSLSTFQWGTLSRKYGLRNPQALASDGRICAWLDLANQIRATDGQNVTEPDISLPIRPDIASITHSSASMAIHTIGKRNYLMLADGGASKIRVYDLDKRQWMPPWAIANTAIGTVETASGTWSLLIGSSAKPLKMDDTGSVFQDAGASYSAYAITALAPMVPPENPADSGILFQISTERSNAAAFSDVSYLLDDDPASGTYVSVFTTTISTNPKAPLNRKTGGTYLIEELWMTGLQTAARRVSVRLDWASANSNFVLYSLDPTYARFLS